MRTLTFADNGQTVSLATGERFLVRLGIGNSYITTIHIDDPGVVSRVDSGRPPAGSQGVFKANVPGETSLTITASPRCYLSCLLASFWFHVQILVR
jgi:hypothetical protein